jgi:hypothetical protein
MPNEILNTSPTNVTSPISSGSASADAGILGSEYDNETNRKRFATFVLNVTHATAATANRVWLLYLVFAPDGSNYEDGDASTKPQRMHVSAFPVRDVTTAQKIVMPAISLPPFKFKPLLWNDTDQSGASVELEMEVWGEEIQ